MTKPRRLPVYGIGPPPTRGHCASVPRPCARDCRHNTGAAERGSSCALDLADNGGMSLVDVGLVLGVTRERVRQIEEQALWSIGDGLRSMGIDETPEGSLARRSGTRSVGAEALAAIALEWEANAPADGEVLEPRSFFAAPFDDAGDRAVAEKVWGMNARRHGIASRASRVGTRVRAAKVAAGKDTSPWGSRTRGRAR